MGANIDPLSGTSLYITLINGECKLGSATGFIVEKEGVKYLITNWHVLSGRHPNTNQILSPTKAVPKEILIWHHSKKLGVWLKKTEKLYDDSNKKLWKEHVLGRKIDVVALPLKNITEEVQLYPLDLLLMKSDIRVEVAMSISILGFPLGFSGGGKFPIWKTGHIASEPDLNYNNEPIFLIDATTRGGMSGSPVFLRSGGPYKSKSGNTILSTCSITKFLGVYSGRLPGDTEIGRVWKPHIIEEVLNKWSLTIISHQSNIYIAWVLQVFEVGGLVLQPRYGTGYRRNDYGKTKIQKYWKEN